MTRTRLGLLGLCAVVFGLMAFSATAAHAEVGAQWLLQELFEDANKEILTKLINFLPAAVKLATDVPGVLHSKIGGVSVLFECSTIATVNAQLLANGSIGEKAGVVEKSKIKFSGCVTKLNGVTSAACEPNAGGTEKGVINTNNGHGLIVLYDLGKDKEGKQLPKHELVQILPDNVGGLPSNKFATIEMGEECSIGTKVPVIGKAFLRDCENAFLTHLLKHLTEVDGSTNTNLTKLWVISETAEHVATILGSAWATLGGIHTGLHFSGDPA